MPELFCNRSLSSAERKAATVATASKFTVGNAFSALALLGILGKQAISGSYGTWFQTIFGMLAGAELLGIANSAAGRSAKQTAGEQTADIAAKTFGGLGALGVGTGLNALAADLFSPICFTAAFTIMAAKEAYLTYKSETPEAGRLHFVNMSLAMTQGASVVIGLIFGWQMAAMMIIGAAASYVDMFKAAAFPAKTPSEMNQGLLTGQAH